MKSNESIVLDFASSGKKVSAKIVYVTPRKPRDNEVLIKVSFCGICGSDFAMANNSGKRYQGVFQLPLVPGHEFSGVIVEKGKTVSREWEIGEPVISEETIGCGMCNYCKVGKFHFCTNSKKIGFTIPGAYTQYVTVSVNRLWSIKSITDVFGKSLGLKLGALIQPYSIPYSAIFDGSRNNWKPGKNILVLGCGPIGFAAADLCFVAGAARVVVVEKDSEKIKKFKKFSAKIVSELPTNKFDYIIDSTGDFELIKKSVSIAAPFGTLISLSRTSKKIELDTENFARQNLCFYSIDGNSLLETYPNIIQLMAANRLSGKMIIDQVVSLQKAKTILEKQRKGKGKILIGFEGK
ncbi:MAG: alcohol dehydrogenase catalytic domain-containing protein [Oligoflexia bacterium]|nr:alcohol dehydrogenase catalytic domain-containing protein [Oligoflexia bacterium]